MPNIRRVAGLTGLVLAGLVAVGVAGCASPPADVAAAAGPKACINPTQIRKQEILSDQEIRFVMDNGDVWTNRLKRECQGLKFEGGFTWKFDPFIWHEFELGDPSPLLQRASCPVAVIWGDRSSLMPPEVVAYMRSLAPAGSPFLAIPDADHHVMIDQPLPFVAAVRGLLAGWPRGAQVATGGGAV